MSTQYSRDHVKISIAKILQTLGWHSINTTPLEIFTDVLFNYLIQLSKITNEYANEFGFTEPNLDHLGLAFREMGVSLPELEEYVKYVNFGQGPAAVCKYPVPREDHLNFLKPGSKEVVTRPVHIHEHLPPMNPLLEGNELENESITPKTEPVDEIDVENTQVFKKPADIAPTEFKRPKREEEGSRPTREISSVMMTTSGFLSPAREGKLPEARTPAPPPNEPTLPPVKPEPELIQLKPPRVIKKIEKKREKVGKELFKPIPDERPKKSPVKDFLKMKNNKIPPPNVLSNLPQGTDVKVCPMPVPINKVNPIKINKTLAAARLKTEKLNTTITPIPMKSNIPPFPIDNVDKLFTLPDKRKVNILKKISNVKNEKLENKILKKEDFKQEPESPPNLIIDEPEDTASKVPLLPSDITIEPIHPVNAMKSPKVETMYYDDDSPPGTPSTPKTPEMVSQSPPLAKEKRKRKDKARVRKTPKYQSPQRIYHDVDNMLMDRPKTPEAPVHSLKHELPFANTYNIPPAVSRNALQLLAASFGGPGLIPSPMSNPLFPSLPFPPINLHDFGQHSYQNHPLPPMHHNPFATFLQKQQAEEPIVLPPPEPVIPEKPKTPEPMGEPIVIKVEKKVKEHKKEKKDKMKKKNKKEKIKNKAEKKKLKEEKKDKEKLKKEKREKRKEKELREIEVAVPKVILKLGSPASRPATPETARKLNIKPIIKKEEEPVDLSEEKIKELSPSLAKISALVTGPPKPKSTPTPPVPPPPAFNDIFPTNPLTNTKKKSKPNPKTRIKEIKKEPIVELPPAVPSRYLLSVYAVEENVREETPSTPVKTGPGPGRPRIHPLKAKPVKPKKKRSPIKKYNTIPNMPFITESFHNTPIKLEPESDAEGNEVWICPACGRQDDGSPMIGCDDCDAWYHWVCVGIQVPPDSNEDWYCRHCLLKKDEGLQTDKKKKRKRRDKKEH